MSSNTSSKQTEAIVKEMVRRSTRAIIFLSAAWFCLTVGVFTVNPVGPVGIFFLCVGIPCLLVSIVYFVRYGLASKKAQDALK